MRGWRCEMGGVCHPRGGGDPVFSAVVAYGYSDPGFPPARE